jgi:hypothetical protein
VTQSPPQPPDRPGDGLDPQLARLLRGAHDVAVDVDVAARHLWTLHRVAEAMTDAGGGPSERTDSRRLAASVLIGAVLLISSGVAIASDEPLPGDALYAVKRSTERVQLLLPRSDASEARLHLRLAETRLEEAGHASVSRPHLVGPLIEEAVRALNHAAVVGGPPLATEVTTVRTRVHNRIAELQLHQVPAPAVAAQPSADPEPDPARPPAPAAAAVAGHPPDRDTSGVGAVRPPSPLTIPADTGTATVPVKAAPEPTSTAQDRPEDRREDRREHRPMEPSEPLRGHPPTGSRVPPTGR